METTLALSTTMKASAFTPGPIGILQRKCACGQHTIAGGECEECRKNRVESSLASGKLLQRRAADAAEPSEVPPIVYDVLRSPGQPLDVATRAFFEPRFGHDFSQVRVHTDAKAAESTRAVNALAYTVGRDVVFGAGQYAPGTTRGNRLLAHELAHRVQQASWTSAPKADLEIGAPGDAHEAEAEQLANIVSDDKFSPRQRRATLRAASVTQHCLLPLLQRALTCPTFKDVEDECSKATAMCKTVEDYCTKKLPTPAELDKKIAEGKDYIDKEGFGPNTKNNFKHWLDNTGSEQGMPTAVFETHKATQEALMTHREKFLDGTRRRLEDGSLCPGTLSGVIPFSGHANAFSVGIGRGGAKVPPHSDDLAWSVGGYQLCSNVRVKAVKTGPDRYKVEFVEWKCQARDCYNWDPGKGVGVKDVTDKDLCCVENAGKAKHFLIHTDVWENKDVESTKEGEIEAKVKPCVPTPTPTPTPVPTPTPTPSPPTKVFLHFNLDKPAVGAGTGESILQQSLTSAGKVEWASLLAQLKANPSWKFQLVGRASPEGPATYNLDLGKRRAQLVAKVLIDNGIDRNRIVEVAPECTRVGSGIYTCGETDATGPEDRQVKVVFAGAQATTP